MRPRNQGGWGRRPRGFISYRQQSTQGPQEGSRESELLSGGPIILRVRDPYPCFTCGPPRRVSKKAHEGKTQPCLFLQPSDALVKRGTALMYVVLEKGNPLEKQEFPKLHPAASIPTLPEALKPGTPT